MATQTYEQLIAGANKIKENELPESNTHDLVGEQLLQMTNKMQEESTKTDNSIMEYNVSKFYPTSGIGGTNKYTLETAIALVPEKYRSIGIKCVFVNEVGDSETWEFKGGSWGADSFSQVGVGKFIDIERKNIINITYFQREVPDAPVPKGSILYKENEKKFFKMENGWKVFTPQSSYASFENKTYRILTYNSSVTELSLLMDSLDKDTLENKINSITESILEVDYIDGYYIDNKGVKMAYHTLCCTDFIEIDGLALSYNCYIFGNACGIALYDENKTFITSYGQGADINNVTIITSVEIPNNAKYACFSTSIKDKNNSKVKIDGHFFNKRTESINNYIESVSNVTNKEIALPNDLVTVNDKYFDNKGAIQNYSTSEKGYTITETYIPVKPSHDYSLVNYLSYGYIVFYTSDKVLINTFGSTSQSQSELNFTTPENCAYIRVTFNRNKKATPSIINKGVSYPINDTGGGTEVKIDVMPAKVWLPNFLGCLQFNTFKNKGYSHIIYYGQSLSDGHVSRQPISTEPLDGCYMLGNNVRNFATNLQPLKSMPDETAAEPPVVGCVNALKNLFDNTSFLSELKLIGTSCGVGGYTIEQLSKNKQLSQGDNVYTTRFLKALNNSKTAVGEEPIECSAIVYMQGEANQETREYPGTGIGVNDVQTRNKDEYKALLKKLKEDMQADIMEIYGQKKPPLFFIYQTSVFYSPIQDMPISMAQFEFAQENEDVILLNPHYYCPTAEKGGGHLNANGYRWYGEQIAKTIYEVFIKGINFNPVIPKEFVIKKSRLYIYCYVPNPPLVIDTYTAIEVKNYGFNIFKDDVAVGINGVNILNGNIIEITTDTDLSTGKIDLSYAGKDQQGRGNVRDSDEWYSFANYVDDTSLEQNNPPYTPVDENGSNYYGKRYPMYNWLSNLFINISND